MVTLCHPPQAGGIFTRLPLLNVIINLTKWLKDFHHPSCTLESEEPFPTGFILLIEGAPWVKPGGAKPYPYPSKVLLYARQCILLNKKRFDGEL